MIWSDFAAAEPEMAAFGVQRLEKRVSYLATIRPDGSPRLHPVVAHFGEGHLFIYMNATSPKAADLQRGGRYTLHCAVEDSDGGKGEFSVSGLAELVADNDL